MESYLYIDCDFCEIVHDAWFFTLHVLTIWKTFHSPSLSVKFSLILDPFEHQPNNLGFQKIEKWFNENENI